MGERVAYMCMRIYAMSMSEVAWLGLSRGDDM